MEFEPMLTPREKSPLPKMSPEEDRTRDAVDSEPKHYQLSYSGPRPGISILWLGEMENLIGSFYLSPWDTLACCWDIKQPINKQTDLQELHCE